MKKLFSILLALAIFLGSAVGLTSCGRSGGNEETSAEITVSDNNTQTEIGSTDWVHFTSSQVNRKLVPGCQGTVRWVDDMGTIHVSWDCGSSLGLIPGEDEFKKN